MLENGKFDRRKSYDFTTGSALSALCKSEDMSISEIMICREMYREETSRAIIIDEMRRNLEVMRESIKVGIEEHQDSVTGLSGGDALKLENYANRSYMGGTMARVAAAAMAVVEVNSAMGKIVAAPTAGSSGVLPGCIITVAEEYHMSDDALISALFTAAAIGMIIAENATLAGAEGGCQAEIGSASAMTAAALCEMRGARPDIVLNASALALKNILGLVCDPVGGLVECPCIKRNAMGAVNAMLAADMSMAGVNSIIPFDEVLMAMRSIGRQMNIDLRETARGGLAATPTGKAIMRSIRQGQSDNNT